MASSCCSYVRTSKFSLQVVFKSACFGASWFSEQADDVSKVYSCSLSAGVSSEDLHRTRWHGKHAQSVVRLGPDFTGISCGVAHNDLRKAEKLNEKQAEGVTIIPNRPKSKSD